MEYVRRYIGTETGEMPSMRKVMGVEASGLAGITVIVAASAGRLAIATNANTMNARKCERRNSGRRTDMSMLPKLNCPAFCGTEYFRVEVAD
jgi:hypothetical protein